MRKTTTILTAIINGKYSFHFTEQPLAGTDNNTWFEIGKNDLFQVIERILIESGNAKNLTSVTEIRKHGTNCVDYQLVYNVTPRKWVEVIPLMGGDYSVPYSVDDDGNDIPYLYMSEEEARAEQQDIAQDYIEQIKSGERDEGDYWDGEIYECELDGDELRLFDDGVCFNVVQWKENL